MRQNILLQKQKYILPQYLWNTVSCELYTKEIPTGLDNIWHAISLLIKKRKFSIKFLLKQADEIMSLEKDIAKLTDNELLCQANISRDIFKKNREQIKSLIYVCAIIREAAFRVFGFRHHREQLSGSLALYYGLIIEMSTGEGKTLAATIPAILNAWRGKGCHVITVNDYLAERDAKEMGKLYDFLKLKVASISQETELKDRKKAYLADITYLTNKEVAADFLRDRLILGSNINLPKVILNSLLGKTKNLSHIVQRGLEYAIVDEADSVLIDEAVTPLLISGDEVSLEEQQVFTLAKKLAENLKKDVDYKVDMKHKDIHLLPAGKEILKKETINFSGFWHGMLRREEIIRLSLLAKYLFKKNHDYIISNGKIIVIDEATGRQMPDRTWRDGLHQAVEAKENLEITGSKSTFARLSFQKFFRFYKKLSGMTGTAKEASKEFWQIYDLITIKIPTHKPCLRKQKSTLVFYNKSFKWQYVLEEVKKYNQIGRPILVGTRNISDSEKLSHMLTKEGIKHNLLNAISHEKEAEIVSQAGKMFAITVATNMAGRGTDIKLDKGVESLGGLHVISVEKNLTSRVDRQLYGRSARQGDNGSAQALVSLDDELVLRFSPLSIKIINFILSKGKQDKPLPKILDLVFRYSAVKAERHALAQRKNVLKSDDWLRDTLGFAGKDL